MYKKPPLTAYQRRERKRLSQSMYRLQNREKLSSDLKVWRKKNSELVAKSHRKTYFKVNYGITPEEAELLLQKQGNVCAICRKPIAIGGKSGAKVDHCHTTNEIRGILCGNCNIGIGQFKEDTSILFDAINYLRSFQRKEIGVA